MNWAERDSNSKDASRFAGKVVSPGESVVSRFEEDALGVASSQPVWSTLRTADQGQGWRTDSTFGSGGTTNMARLFISYARSDGAQLAERLEVDLRASDHEPWRDRSEIQSGQDWARTIEDAIDRCEAMIAVLTSGSYRSEICRGEQQRALRKQKRLFPLLAQKDADRPIFLEARHYLDFSDVGRYKFSYEDLLKQIQNAAGVSWNDLPARFQDLLSGEIPVRSAGVLLQRQEAQWSDVCAIAAAQRARFLEALSPRQGSAGIFEPDLYIARTEAERELEAFLGSNARALLLIGSSGVGKTNLLCKWSDAQSAAGHVALIYSCDRFATADVERELLRDLGLEEPGALPQALAHLDALAGERARRLIFVFDGINDFRGSGAGNDQQQLLTSIDAFVARLPGDNLRVVLSCSTASWRRLERLGARLTWGRYHRTRSEEPFVLLKSFDNDEAGAAFEAYRKFFGLTLTASDLPYTLRVRLRDPLVLRLLAETHRSGRVSTPTLDTQVFARYYEDRVRRREDQYFVDTLVEEMWTQASATLPIQSLAGHPVLGQAVRSDDAGSSYNRLLDEGVLLEVSGDLYQDDLVRFTYPLVGAYVLARRRSREKALLRETLGKLVEQADKFPLAWDAAVILLAMQSSLDAYVEFAGASDPDRRELACASLVRLHDSDREQASRILQGLLDSDSPAQQRTALRASFTIGPGARDLILRAAVSKSKAVQQAVKDTLFLIWSGGSGEGNASTIYVLWRHAQDFTHELMRDLVARISYGKPLELFRISPFVLSWCITLYINHCERPDVARQVTDLFYDLFVGQLHLDKLQRVPRLIVRVFASAGTGPVIEETSMEDPAIFFARPASERSVLASAAQLVDPAADFLASEDLILRMLGSDVNAQRLTATLVLAIHSYADFARSEPLHRRLFEKLGAEGRLWQLTGFSVLLPATPAEWIPLLEDMTRRIYAEHADVASGRTGLPKGLDILLVPLGLAYGKRGVTMPLIAELLAAELATGDHERIARLVARLGPVGFYNPKGVLGVLQPHLNALAALDGTRDALLTALATTRTVHLDVVDECIVDAGLDESFHRQLVACTDTDLISRFMFTIGLYNNAVHQCLFYPRMRRGLTIFPLERLAQAASAPEVITDFVMEGLRMAREVDFRLLEWTRPD